ncbi:hypothetical protein ABIA52_000743 [Paenarthrobacter histidinolovorans]|uniref:Uncharacterized protein n=1 Tax=Paenarthrobacter histidinolovorans TaxID=43664 RepID=A0ABW8N1G9_9MICC
MEAGAERTGQRTNPNISHRSRTVISYQTLDRVVEALVNLIGGKRFHASFTSLIIHITHHYEERFFECL